MIGALPFLAAITPPQNDGGDGGNNDKQVTFNFNTACCSTNVNQDIKNKRVTYRAPEGATAADAPGGTLTTEQMSWIGECLKSCCAWLCCRTKEKSEEAPRPLSKEEENEIANRVLVNYLIEKYGLVPALAAIEACGKTKGRHRHHPTETPQAPLTVKHIKQLSTKAEQMQKIFQPFYQEIVHYATPHGSRTGVEDRSKSNGLHVEVPEGSPSLPSEVNLGRTSPSLLPIGGHDSPPPLLITRDELKVEDQVLSQGSAPPPYTVRCSVELPEHLKRSLSDGQAPRSPKDCLALIEAIEKGEAKVQVEHQVDC